MIMITGKISFLKKKGYVFVTLYQEYKTCVEIVNITLKISREKLSHLYLDFQIIFK